MHDGMVAHSKQITGFISEAVLEHRTVKLAKNVAKVKDQVATRGKVHPEEDKPPQKKRMKQVRKTIFIQ